MADKIDFEQALETVSDFLKEKNFTYTLYAIKKFTTQIQYYDDKTIKIEKFPTEIAYLDLFKDQKKMQHKMTFFASEKQIQEDLNRIIDKFEWIDPLEENKIFLPPNPKMRNLSYNIYDNNIESEDYADLEAAKILERVENKAKNTPQVNIEEFFDFYNEEKKSLNKFKMLYEYLKEFEQKTIGAHSAITAINEILYSEIEENHYFFSMDSSKEYEQTFFKIDAFFDINDGSVKIPITYTKHSHFIEDVVHSNVLNSIKDELSSRLDAKMKGQIIYGRRTKVLFTQRALVPLLNFIAKQLIYQPDMIFANKELQYFHSEFSLTHDGTLTRGINTRPFDEQGVNTEETELIQEGMIKNYLFATVSEENSQQKLSGINYRYEDFQFTPRPANLIMGKGNKILLELTDELDPGILVTHISDLFLDPENHLIILCDAMNYTQGKKSNVIKNLTVKMPVSSFFKNIEAIGKDPIIIENITGYPILFKDVYVESISV